MTPEEPTQQMPRGSEAPTEVTPTGEPGGRRWGVGFLVASMIVALALAGAYLAAGGPVGPDPAADPCDPRPWTDPQNLEEAAQQFALSAADGAACELGVSREELSRSIADDETRRQFMDEHGFGDTDLEDALRAGLNRAVDDAENAGALEGLVATGLRAAIRVMPMAVMVDLLENADSIFSGDLGSLGEIGDLIESVTGGLEGLGTGTTDDPLDGLGEALEKALPEGATEDLEQLENLIPEETRRQFEDEARDRLEQGLNDLFGP